MRAGDDSARRERRDRLARRERVGTGRVEPVLHGLDDGVHDPDVGVQLKDLREDQRLGCDAEDDRQEDDSLEGGGPAYALGQHREHQAYHGHDEGVGLERRRMLSTAVGDCSFAILRIDWDRSAQD